MPYCPNPVKIEISGLNDVSLQSANVPSWAVTQHDIVPATGNIMLLPLQSICVTSGEDVTDHLHFKDMVTAGTSGNGMYVRMHACKYIYLNI